MNECKMDLAVDGVKVFLFLWFKSFSFPSACGLLLVLLQGHTVQYIHIKPLFFLYAERSHRLCYPCVLHK